MVEQGSAPLMEDVLLTKDALFAVFDGATSINGEIFNDGLTGGRIAAELAARAFARNNDSLQNLFRKANQAIANELAARNIALTDRQRLWSASMAALRVEDDGFSWCQTGDAMIIAIMADGRYRLITPESNHDHETFRLWRQTKNPDNLPISDLLAAKIQEVRLGMNRTYGVLNGEPSALDFLNSGYQPLAGIRSLLIFTDGIFLPTEDPTEQTDWHKFVTLYDQHGLHGLQAYVREHQRQDSDCRRYPRFKIHDDIAAVSLEFPLH